MKSGKGKVITLKDREYIQAVVPEKCSGPGWANAPTWVYISDGTTTRMECIQPEERSTMLHYLFPVAEPMMRSLVASVATKRLEEER